MQHPHSQQAPAVDEDWWSGSITAPYEAAAINFVVNYEGMYDNNNRQDHKVWTGSVDGCGEVVLLGPLCFELD